MKHWYVYVATYNSEVVYIGKGIGDRYLHLNSGISSCYEANKVHFAGGIIECSLFASFLSESDTLIFEKNLIIELRPTWNIIFVGKQKDRLSTDKRFSKKGSSKFMGVGYYEGTSPKHWRAKVHSEGKCYHVGYYHQEIDAAIARDIYILNNGIEGLVLNFPNKNYQEILDEHVKCD